ncbi:MAG: M15 family metallopeptidase [Firmicutes bacterium]|nr:M15 family metallopeptidase [Bacillota bacterium]
MKFRGNIGAALLLVLAAGLAYVVFLRAGAPPLTSEAAVTPPVSAAELPSSSPSPPLTPSPSLTLSPTLSPAPTPTPSPTPELPAVDLTAWNLALVNSDHPLDKDFSPDVITVENSQKYDARAADALKTFIAAARDKGFSVYLSSGYRTYATQEYLFNRKVSQMEANGLQGDAAITAAARIVAYPGASEHQLGLAADITDKYYEIMDVSLADTPLLQWMKAHCAEYGFILRYPEGKQDITGVMFEPWHFRYVGTDAAAYIMEHGLCLEEFWALYEE